MLNLVPVTPAISMIQAPNNGRFPYANSLLVQDGGITALVDTGCGHAAIRELLAKYPVDMVICTHSHVDHTSGNWLLTGRPIWMPGGIGFETGGEVSRMVPRFIHDETLHETWISSTISATGFRDAPLTDSYEPGHIFEIGGIRLHAIPAPGHLSDHTCLWEPETGTLLATDIDFSRFGPWYGNPESDIDAFEDSIRRVWRLNPRTVISSHKGVYREDLDMHFQTYLDHFGQREARILDVLREAHSPQALVSQAIIYGRFPRAEAMLRYFEKEMVQKHLERLEEKKLVRQVTPGVFQRSSFA
jgi:glyoxylase-like metal-dependent hydrolase (beta-lactamase superfamily II)